MFCRAILPCLVGVLVIAGHTAAQSFSIAVLPDTQKYSEALGPDPGGFPPVVDPEGTAHIFRDQVQWVVDNAAALNIRYLAHLGDIVEHGNGVEEWDLAKSAMDLLTPGTGWAGLPYGTCMGNHDNHGFGVPHTAANISPTTYLSYFGPQHYVGESWYRGASPSGKSNYQVVNAGGRDLLMLNVSIDTPQAELDWAQTVLSANPDKPTILSTHRYLYDFRLLAGRYGDGVIGTNTYDETGLASELYEVTVADGGPGTVWPHDLWNNFIKQNRNVFMVLAGHCHGQYEQVSTNDFGLPVIEVLTDYQDGVNGGNGWLRLMEFDLAANTIEFSTFSPTNLPVPRYRSTLVDDYFETIQMVEVYGPTLAAAQGLDYELLKAQLRADLPWFEIEDHSDWAMFEAMLTALGEDPEEYKWEGLWAQVFCDNPMDPFGGGPRDAQFTIALGDYTDAAGRPVTLDAYVVPEPNMLVLLAAGLVTILLSRARRTLAVRRP